MSYDEPEHTLSLDVKADGRFRSSNEALGAVLDVTSGLEELVEEGDDREKVPQQQEEVEERVLEQLNHLPHSCWLLALAIGALGFPFHWAWSPPRLEGRRRNESEEEE